MKDLAISIIIANKIKQGDDVAWPPCNDNRSRASNVKEGGGKNGWDRFKELMEHENNDHKDHGDALSDNEGMDQIRIDRFHHEQKPPTWCACCVATKK